MSQKRLVNQPAQLVLDPLSDWQPAELSKSWSHTVFKISLQGVLKDWQSRDFFVSRGTLNHANSLIYYKLRHALCIMFRGVQKLLDATGQRMVDVGTNDGHTPLHVAAVNGLRQIAQLLVEIVSYE